jgi:hypothetical protein
MHGHRGIYLPYFRSADPPKRRFGVEQFVLMHDGKSHLAGWKEGLLASVASREFRVTTDLKFVE